MGRKGETNIILFLALMIIFFTNFTKECLVFGQPNNGQIGTNCERQISGCELSFTCDEGYILDGPSVLTCQDNGTWGPTNNPPECKQIRKSRSC
jgi:hypothetical protein